MVSRVDWKSKVFGKYWGRTLLSKNRTSHLEHGYEKDFSPIPITS